MPAAPRQPKEIITCTTCIKKFPSHFAYNKHVAKCKTSAHVCFICAAKFDSPSSVLNHQKSQLSHVLHAGKVFIYDKEACMFSSTTKKGLEYHVERTHSGAKFACEVCELEFDTCTSLSDHKKTPEHKQSQKTTPCPGKCGRFFHGNYEAKRHFNNSCCLNPAREVKCTVCNCKMGQAKDFLIHLHKEHASKDKYLCTR